ncbi:MAG: FecR domain-containing protein [Gammaproteobacteria bacterium]|nr:FecR domain-containing protein [Gammaproteobacteria bacterium]
MVSMWNGKAARALRIALLAAAACGNALADAGKLLYVRGNTSAQAPGQHLRIVAAGAPVMAGDTISTGAESFAVIELRDTTRILLRPNTSFQVSAYDETTGRESIGLNLLKGGIRAITGLLGKQRPDAFRLNGSIATIGIRGTDFALRLCGPECGTEAENFPKLATPKSTIIGRALAAVGEVNVIATDRQARRVVKGTPLYVGDVVSAAAAAYGVLVLEDGTRVTLQPKSEFKIAQYRHAPAAPESESALFSLLRGGLRMATGLMASRRHESIKVGTAVATIGIRGTGFDLLETAACGGKQAATDHPGLTTHVWKGAVTLQESNAEVKEGETVCLLERGGPVSRGEPKPRLETPRPDDVPIPSNTFDTLAQTGTEPGLQLTVFDGHVVLTNNGGELNLGSGEDGFTDGLNRLPVRTRNSQSLGRSDPFFRLDLKARPESWDAFDPVQGLECPVGG